ncbi:hypothetical protein K4K55_003698 [Colletotrichum sp. SAR 10_96]|nr:hypothetical protein K4K55_003698 [Colletotrichum sp. SAR 10_96]
MEYKRQSPTAVKVKPRLIIHGGAGNIKPANLAPPQYAEYRAALLTIISKTNAYMTTPTPTTTATAALPSALETAVHAVTLLENDPLFNSGHGAVFTRDGINELEASVMVTRGFAKRGVGVTGLRHVRNPILLAKAMLEHGEADLGGGSDSHPSSSEIDAPSAQGHTLLHGPTAELLAEKYGLELVEPGYFFTQRRWDEHIRALERERTGEEGNATWRELQRSAGDRWRVTGEGEGGIIGIEVAVTRDEEGGVVGVRSEILQDFNCNGMYRAWIDDEGLAHAKIYHDEVEEGVDARLYAEKW